MRYIKWNEKQISYYKKNKKNLLALFG